MFLSFSSLLLSSVFLRGVEGVVRRSGRRRGVGKGTGDGGLLADVSLRASRSNAGNSRIGLGRMGLWGGSSGCW